METSKIILIGGAPAIGKTFLTKKLSRLLNIPYTSTDEIRDKLRKKITDPTIHPELFMFERSDLPYIAKYLNNTPANEIFNDINKENEIVWKSVLNFISEGGLGTSYIIEGMAITPKNVHDLIKTNDKIKPLFLIETNPNRIREIIYTRGLWDSAYKYPDNLKEKELDWVLLFNNWIESECNKYNFPVITTEKIADNIQPVKDIVLS